MTTLLSLHTPLLDGQPLRLSPGRQLTLPLLFINSSSLTDALVAASVLPMAMNTLEPAE